MPRTTLLSAVSAIAVLAMPRAAGQGNSRLPPNVEYKNKSPEITVKPGDDPSGDKTWFVLKFGKVREMTEGDEEVWEHVVDSLAEARDIMYTQEEREEGGVMATVTRMEAPLRGVLGTCGGSRDMYVGTGKIAVETMVFTADAKVDYGNETVDVPREMMKFNIDSSKWPFCDNSAFLEFALDVKVKNDGKATMASGSKGKELRVMAGEKELVMGLPTKVIVDEVMKECSVELDTQGTWSVLTFKFPRFSQKLVYDPTAGAVEGGDAASEGGDAASEAGDSSTTPESAMVSDVAPTWTPAPAAIVAAVVAVAVGSVQAS